MDGLASRLNAGELIARWLATAVPELDATRQRVAVALTRLLAEGEPISVRHLATAVALPEAAVEEALGGLRTVSRDEQGRATSACGLTLSATDFRLSYRGRSLYTWCALDTFLVAGLLGGDVRSDSCCPVTGEPVSVHAGPGGVRFAEPASAVMSLSLADLSRPGPIGAAFCRHVKFFASGETCERWLAGERDVVPVALDEAGELADTLNRATFPAALGGGT